MKQLGLGIAGLGVIAILFAQLVPRLATGHLASGAASALTSTQYGGIQNVGIFLIVVGLIASRLQNEVRLPPETKEEKRKRRRAHRPAPEELPDEFPGE